jgi:hypothetical protein
MLWMRRPDRLLAAMRPFELSAVACVAVVQDYLDLVALSNTVVTAISTYFFGVTSVSKTVAMQSTMYKIKTYEAMTDSVERPMHTLTLKSLEQRAA